MPQSPLVTPPLTPLKEKTLFMLCVCILTLREEISSFLTESEAYSPASSHNIYTQSGLSSNAIWWLAETLRSLKFGGIYVTHINHIFFLSFNCLLGCFFFFLFCIPDWLLFCAVVKNDLVNFWSSSHELPSVWGCVRYNIQFLKYRGSNLGSPAFY